MKKRAQHKVCVRILANDRPVPASIVPAPITDAATVADVHQD